MEQLLDSLFNHRNILNCDRQVYLTRWYVFRRNWMAIYIHRFDRSDEDRALHCHPFNFISIILKGGYTEHTENSNKKKHAGMILFRRATWKHRVELIDGKTAWSIIIRFKRKREWGFWPDGKFVNWRDWWQANCID